MPGDSQCDTAIVDSNNKPKKSFLYHDFKDYLASLYAREDLEGQIDHSCSKFAEAYAARKNFDSWDSVTDIFQGNFFNDLKSPTDPLNPAELTTFLSSNGRELRTVFALHVDFFNVNGMLIQGSSTSCGTIMLVCTSLKTSVQ